MPIHPAIVHFPIVITVVLVIFEFRKDVTDSLKLLMLLFFAVTLSIAFFTGLSDSNSIDQIPISTQEVLSIHYALGRVVFFLGLILPLIFVLNTKLPESRVILLNTYRIILGILLLLVGATGFYGGKLIYEQSFGIKAPHLSD